MIHDVYSKRITNHQAPLFIYIAGLMFLNTYFNMSIQKKFVMATMHKIPIMLNTIPYVAIVLMETTPELMAIALGGVAIICILVKYLI